MARILLVEDNEMNRDMLSRRLTKRGHEVTIAVDGAQGVEMARADAPDLILMDMSLPVMSGWDATSALKGDEQTRGIRFPWGVLRGSRAQKAASVAFSLSPLAEAMKVYGKLIHRREEMFNEKDMAATEDKADTSTLPAIFDFRYTNGPRTNASIDAANLVDASRPDASFGYVRIKSFNGGPGQIAVHGNGQLNTVGQNVSNGCIRVFNDVILQIAKAVPLGTPVTIEA